MITSQNEMSITIEKYEQIINRIRQLEKEISEHEENKMKVLITTEKHVYNHMPDSSKAIMHKEIGKQYINMNELRERIIFDERNKLESEIQSKIDELNLEKSELTSNLNDLKLSNDALLAKHQQTLQDSSKQIQKLTNKLKLTENRLKENNDNYSKEVLRLKDLYTSKMMESDTISSLKSAIEMNQSEINLAKSKNEALNQQLMIKVNQINEYKSEITRYTDMLNTERSKKLKFINWSVLKVLIKRIFIKNI